MVAITLVLMSLLVLEMYRHIKFVRVHDVAREVEEEAVEVQLDYLGRERCHAHPAALCFFFPTLAVLHTRCARTPVPALSSLRHAVPWKHPCVCV
jgi:hypothetical protein